MGNRELITYNAERVRGENPSPGLPGTPFQKGSDTFQYKQQKLPFSLRKREYRVFEGRDFVFFV
jgi:hypothetical protein